MTPAAHLRLVRDAEPAPDDTKGPTHPLDVLEQWRDPVELGGVVFCYRLATGGRVVVSVPETCDDGALEDAVWDLVNVVRESVPTAPQAVR